MEDQKFWMIWPEARTVTGKTLMVWASDVKANGETDQTAKTPNQAALILQELGHITLGNYGLPIKEATKGF